MKTNFIKTVLVLLACTFSLSLWAQSPEKMSYQAVIRDASSNLVKNHSVGIQISIIHGDAFGASLYVERQTSTTNGNGLLSIEIGSQDATVIKGIFANIDWTDGPYFIKTETDPAGGTNYSIIGTSQLLSVPYALHAKTAETVTGTITETDPEFSGWDKSTGISISKSQISDLGTSIEEETDPVFGASVASAITATDTAKWNSTDIETDPTYTNSDAAQITASDITNLSNLSGTNTGDQDLSTLATKTALGDSTALLRSEIPSVSEFATTTSVTTGLDGKVDKETGKGLSTNDYTTAEQTKLAAITGTNTGDQDLSTLATKVALEILENQLKILELKLQLHSGVSVSDLIVAGISVSDLIAAGVSVSDLILAGASSSELIGKDYQGGKIAYFLVPGDPGYDANIRHGIIAAPSDQSAGAPWGCQGTIISGADGAAIGTGNQNTIDIEAGCVTAGTAADICANLVLGGYSDWYLPSKDELSKLSLNRTSVGGFFDTDFYWSSTESNMGRAWYLYIYYFLWENSWGRDSWGRVRAVRAF